MKINQISRRIKRGFTLIELTVVILTTSILLVGFTAFTLFFTNQYSYEMGINDTENSAITLKYAISNNVDKFNYTYETVKDFTGVDTDEDGVLEIFSTVTPIEAANLGDEDVNYYSGAIIRNYNFYLQKDGLKPYFGYKEMIYDFGEDLKSLPTNQREVKVRQFCESKYKTHEEEFIIYEARSRMEVSYRTVESTGLETNCKKIEFTIDYDFESESLDVAGTRKIVFNKYVYFIN